MFRKSCIDMVVKQKLSRWMWVYQSYLFTPDILQSWSDFLGLKRFYLALILDSITKRFLQCVVGDYVHVLYVFWVISHHTIHRTSWSSGLIDWSIDWLIDWLIDRLIERLIWWLIEHGSAWLLTANCDHLLTKISIQNLRLKSQIFRISWTI